jgi:hypothetical protein
MISGSEITSHSALIHDYYARETKVSFVSFLHELGFPKY